MSTVSRGVRNAFRNNIRTGSVVVLLGISSALALALLLANQAVKSKVTDLKQNAATTLTVNSAGSFGGEGGGEPLTTADVTKVTSLSHVSQVGAISSAGGGGFRVSRSAGGSGTAQIQAPTSNVNLDSSINPGTLGTRRFQADSGTSSSAPLPDIKLPVTMTGLQGTLDRNGTPFKVTSGTGNFSAADVPEALVGQGLATKNSLKVGSTFTAYSTTFKVIGIFDAGNEFGNDGLYVPIATAQRLSGQAGEISQIFVRADTIDNLDGVKTAIGNALGNTRVDITSASQNTTDAINALGSIQHISIIGAVVALTASAVITFLIMVMTVRERRREIGVLKAIGASNFKIVSQFVSEALVLTLCGAVVGVALAAVTSNSITGALVSSNTPAASTSGTSTAGGGQTAFVGGGGGGGRGFARAFGAQAKSATDLLKNVQTSVGTNLLLEGFAAAIAIAALGSAIPAFLIAKVRPAEVMRGE